MRKLFKGGNYSRAETIRGNTVDINLKAPFLIKCGYYIYYIVPSPSTALPLFQASLLVDIFHGINFLVLFPLNKANLFCTSCKSEKKEENKI